MRNQIVVLWLIIYTNKKNHGHKLKQNKVEYLVIYNLICPASNLKFLYIVEFVVMLLCFIRSVLFMIQLNSNVKSIAHEIMLVIKFWKICWNYLVMTINTNAWKFLKPCLFQINEIYLINWPSHYGWCKWPVNFQQFVAFVKKINSSKLTKDNSWNDYYQTWRKCFLLT